MKTIEDYTNYCTKEQTNRAIKLGCPCYSPEDYTPIKLPTTQQVINWLREERNIEILVSSTPSEWHFVVYAKDVLVKYFYIREYAKSEIAAIDAALDYLEKGE